MSIYSRLGRLVKPKGDPITSADYPCDVELHMVLSPADAFGVDCGTRSTAQLGQPIGMLFNANDGSVRMGEGGLIDQISLQSCLAASVPISVVFNGNRMDATLTAHTRSDLTETVGVLNEYVPPLLTLYFGVPIKVEKFHGRVSGKPVNIEIPFGEGGVHASTRCSQEAGIRAAVDAAGVLTQPEMQRLMAALYYYQQAVSLDPPGCGDPRYFAEVTLNLYKALEVLFGESRQAWRMQGKLHGLNPQSIERLCSISVLRNQLDVAHVALQPLSLDERNLLYFTMHSMEGEVRKLLKKLVGDAAAGVYKPAPPARPSGGREKILKTLQELKESPENHRAESDRR